jgi:hypothetical protein
MPSSGRLLVGATYGAALLASTSLSLFGAFLPAYQVEQVPSHIEHALELRYEDVAELIGSDPPVVHARPGDWVQVRLTGVLCNL